jgi:hypothetical protein
MRAIALLAACVLLPVACSSDPDGPAPSEAGIVGGLPPVGSGGAGPSTSTATSTSSSSSTGVGGAGGEGGGSGGLLPNCACISELTKNDDCQVCSIGVQMSECAFAYNACQEDVECSVAVDLCIPNCPAYDAACIETCLAISPAARSRADTLHACYCTACTGLCGVNGAGGAGGGDACL